MKVLLKKTEIATKFLTTTDLARLEGGVKIIGTENLNSLLEDLE